jgi:hypothetical protein
VTPTTTAMAEPPQTTIEELEHNNGKTQINKY